MMKDIVNRNDKGQLHGIQIGYYYDNPGQIMYKHNYINGHKHGEQLRYYETGQIMYKYNYINGYQHGEKIGYYSNGEIMYKQNYINDQYHGEQIGYYKNGQIDYIDYCINGDQVSKEEYLAYERRSKLTIIKDL
jgi:antitoxin component YwqK of YwqJK toxin-antitoxin module